MFIDKRIYEFLKFCIVGTMALFTQYVAYYVLFKLINEYNASYFISYLLSAIFNFILTIRYTFRVSFSYKKLFGFFFCHLFNLAFQIFLLNIFIWMGIREELAPFPVYIIAVPSNFILVRYAMTKRE